MNDYYIYVCIFGLLFNFSDSIPPTIESLLIGLYLCLIPVGGIFWWMDTHINWWTNSKIAQRQEILSTGELIPQIFVNNIVLVITAFMLNQFSKRGIGDNTNTQLYFMLIDFFVIYFIYDGVFYFGHRIIHHPRLYALIHKKHHTTFAGIALSTHYMTIADFFIEIIFPFWIAAFAWNSCFISTMAFLVIGQINGLVTHSGYNLPGLPPPDAHYDHHTRIVCNFGVGGIWDYVFDTHSKN